jgi:hypothetical protein
LFIFSYIGQDANLKTVLPERFYHSNKKKKNVMKMELSNFILQMDTLLLDSKIIKKENDIQEENDIHEKDKSKNIALLQQR